MTEKELDLVEEKIRFYRMINGLIAGGFFVSAAYLAYIILSRIVA